MCNKLKKYVPGNCSEVESFIDDICNNCESYCDEITGKYCPIISYVMFRNGDEENYPSELVVGDSGPDCTAFKNKESS